MIGRVDAAAIGVPEANAPKDNKHVAEQFESLLIAQMLRSARAGEGWFGTGEDSTAESAMGLAEEQFASAMAAQGGLGLSRLIAEGLARK
jgi:Rod binding domain-containing protein